MTEVYPSHRVQIIHTKKYNTFKKAMGGLHKIIIICETVPSITTEDYTTLYKIMVTFMLIKHLNFNVSFS